MEGNISRPSDNHIIDVDKLTFSYGSRRIFSDVSFKIFEGEFVSILGGSGSGKSTLLLLMASFLDPDNQAIKRVGSLGQPAMVFQRSGIFEWMSVIDNIRFPMRLKNIPKNIIYGRALQLLELIRLSDRADTYPGDLSHGMRQRVELARAWAADTPLILLDEPLSGLDYQLRCDIQRDLLQLWEAEQRSVIMVTHDPEEACFLSDRILVLSAPPSSLRQINVPFSRPRSEELRYSGDFNNLKKEVLCQTR